jgi:hypothetical protein
MELQPEARAVGKPGNKPSKDEMELEPQSTPYIYIVIGTQLVKLTPHCRS